MLLDLIIALFCTMVKTAYGAVMSLVPAPPGWLMDHAEEAAQIWQIMAGFETWAPISLAFQIAAAMFTIYSIGLGIGLARVIVSYLTLGGGAT